MRYRPTPTMIAMEKTGAHMLVATIIGGGLEDTLRLPGLALVVFMIYPFVAQILIRIRGI